MESEASDANEQQDLGEAEEGLLDACVSFATLTAL